jgi:acetyl-CoA acetyltransferase
VGRRVAIAGVALSDCGRVDTTSPFALHHQAASRALADAGLDKGDVDGFASRFCKKGEGGPFVEGGTMRVGGALPTNTDGGGLSACHPGMRGIFLLVEAVRQLRDEAGARQVAGAELACVNGTGGWFSSASTVILGVE